MSIDIESLLIKDENLLKVKSENGNRSTIPKKKLKKFIKGPIDFEWVSRACKISGNAARLAWLIWFLQGVTKSDTVKLTNVQAKNFGLNRNSKYIAIRQLVNAGLIKLKKTERGKSIIVDIVY